MKRMFTYLNSWLNRILLITLLLLPAMVCAQKITISGTVTDENKNNLPGVNVIVKGTVNGTTTDADGRYVLNVADGNGALIFSFIGYASQEVMINNRTQLDMVLPPEVRMLSDVVVVGYGIQRRADLTESITSIKSESLREIPVISAEQALQGRMAGVQVQQTSGQPGAGLSIRVRGVTSIAGGNEPLYVIDGLPQFNGDVRVSNGMATINSSDIESIEVLKDAAATAIYGSRGSNGVVMITTKSGKPGATKVGFETSLGLQQVRNKLDLMNRDEWIAYTQAYYANSGQPVPAELTNTTLNANTDWQDEIFRVAPQYNANLSISGGSDRNKFYVSTGYLNQDGIVINSGYKRTSLRLNVDSKVSNRLSIQSRLMLSRAQQNGFAQSIGTNTRNFGKSGIGSTLLAVPLVPVKNPDGTYTDITPFAFNGVDAENPVALARETLDRNTTTRVQGGADFRLEIFKGLFNTTRLGADYYTIRRDLYFPRILPQLGSGIGTGELGLYDKLNTLVEDFLEYKYELSGDSYIEAIAGMSYQSEQYNTMDVVASGFVGDVLKNYNFSSAITVGKPVTDVIENRIISGFGRVRFNYKEKYLLAASVRRDGASVFSENHKWGVFPSASAAWRVSEEPFLRAIPAVSNLKVRASWGQAGNPAIKPYQSLLLGQVVNTGQGAGTGLSVGLTPSFPNPNLKWETTSQTNIGVDAALMNDQYRLTFDYYVKNTTDLLAQVQLPPSSAYDRIIDNVGEIKNRGWELTLGANVIQNSKWDFAVDVNLSHNKNEVTKTKDNKDLTLAATTGGNDVSRSISIIRVGQPLSAFYGPKFIGFNESGTPQYADLNGDNTISAPDYQVIGNPFPTWNYGINTTLKYDRFTLTTTWQGVGGNTINNVVLTDLTAPKPEFNRLKNMHEFYPSPNNTVVHIVSSRYMEDGDYFRLRNVRLDYNFDLSKNKTVKALNVYVSGQNLLTFTNYSGFDPDINSFNGNDLRQGIDLGAYPTAKTYYLGVNVTF